MKNETYDYCYNGSIREKVATFIDGSPLLTHLKNEKYYELEDSIVNLIQDIIGEIKHRTVYLVQFDWSTDDADGIETFLFNDYDAAYQKFKDLVMEECNPETSWVGDRALDEDKEPNEGYLLDYDDNNSGESEVYFHVTEERNYNYHSFIDLVKKEII